MTTKETKSLTRPNGKNGQSEQDVALARNGEHALHHDGELAIPHYYTTALRLVKTPDNAVPLARGVVLGIVGFFVILLVAPWVQNVAGSGAVTSFSPDQRPQTIDALIDGRIQKWYVKEGDRVKQGDTIVVLRDIDTKFLDPEFEKRQRVIRDNEAREAELAVTMAEQKVIQAKQKYLTAKANVVNANVDAATARQRYERAEQLFAQGLASRRELESNLLALQKAMNDSVKAAATLEIERQAVANAETELEAKRRLAQAKIAKADLELNIATSRKDFGVMLSPIDGYVTRIMQVGDGQTVKKNDKLAIVVPETDDIAAEIFVGSLDAAIVDTGRKVRLQFAGFPAIQAPGGGFPDFAIGTFGGIVKVVDAVDDGNGKYRVLVVPDPNDKPWPSRAYLRQGTEVTGWILLETVPLGYELWRQLNGFPPIIPVKGAKASDGKSKPPLSKMK
ncbi:MAG: biotin/lipoyl-binding protein [Chloroherpetonaceae bacterium]|nr:biotin/lipoyl-binding protein [Chloroherpetonaceae bacterium]MDW8437451.1 biotin/lipoyl-binding protein [Chloroherpetonaceae bacterium]